MKAAPTRLVCLALLLGCIVAFLGGCAKHAPMPVVPEVDLDRYQGLWHEIARLPHRFQSGCTQTTARYSLNDDGTVTVMNRCLKNGQADTAEGKAWVSGPEPSKLRVQFFWPFSGAYWIIALDSDYRWAMVGHPSREYLWILARAPDLDAEILDQLKAQAMALGYDLEPLIVASP